MFTGIERILKVAVFGVVVNYPTVAERIFIYRTLLNNNVEVINWNPSHTVVPMTEKEMGWFARL